MKSPILALTQEQTSSVLQEAWGRPNLRNRHMMQFMIHTGIKIGELVQLNIGDVHTGVRVRKSLCITPRIGKRWRRIPLDREAREAVALVLEYNRSQGFTLDPEGPLFISRQRNRKDPSFRITCRQVQRIVKAVGRHAALGFDMTPRTLRHTFAKSALGQGADLAKVQRLLGHSDYKTTVLYYRSTRDQVPVVPVSNAAPAV